jgi:hypothetical protein
MQIYSKEKPHGVLEPGRARKLSGATRWSHGLLHAGDAGGPVVAVLLLAMLAAAGCAGAAGAAAAGVIAGRPIGVASPIDAAQLSRDLTAFAADSMRGRETGTPDATRAAQFIAERLASLGLEPVGDSMFYQRVPMVRQVVAASTRIMVTKNGVSQGLDVGGDILPMMSLGEGQPDPRRLVDADVVFAGYAIASKTLNRDDFKSIDLQDQVAVFLHGAPPGVTGAVKDSLDSDAEMSRQLARVAIQRPAAIVVLMTGDATELYRQLYPNLMLDVRGRLVATPTLAGVQIPMLLFGLAKIGSPLLPPRWPADDRAQALDGSRLIAQVEVRREPFIGFNVVARVPGTDPALRGTYVALGAHYDHIGILPSLRGDSIANGADDDGSGSMALLAIAATMVKHPARRSTLFVWHVGEEKGLLGSAYFTANPTVPLDSIVAQLNADMIGRNQRDSLFVVGPRAAPNGQSRRLGEIIDSVNAGETMPFAIDRSWDDANHPLQIYQRSDHFNYARRGIPVAFFTTGLHADYHEVGDEARRIDYDKLARVTRLMLGVTRAVGNSGQRPR